MTANLRNLRLGLLLSLLATACGANPEATPASAPEIARDPSADAGPAEAAALDGVPGEASDPGEAAPPADGGSLALPDTALPDTAPPADSAPPAWDACEVATIGAPLRIAQPLFPTRRARALTVTGERLLYISEGVSSTEISMAKTTPGSPAINLLYQSDLSLLATNGRDVVFSTKFDNLGSTDLVGSWPKSFGAWARSIAVDERDVFYTVRGVAKDGLDGSVWRVPIGGGGMGKKIAAGAVSSGLARDASGLYLGSAYTPPLETPELYIARLDPAGTSADELAMRSGFYDSLLALTPSHVVVLALGAKSEVFTVRKSDGVMKTLATLTHPFEAAIDTDGTYAYWIASQQIRRIALDGATPVETLFAGACEPLSLAVDGEHVYFLTSPWSGTGGNTTVWRLKKP